MSYLVPFVYQALAEKVIASTTTETSLLSTTARGTPTIGPNIPQGTAVNFYSAGLYTLPALSPGTLTIKTKLGGIVLASQAPAATLFTSILGSSAKACIINFTLTFRTIGTNAVVQPSGYMAFVTTLGQFVYMDLLNNGQTLTVDTTVPQTFDCTAQWSNANANSLNVEVAQLTMTS